MSLESTIASSLYTDTSSGYLMILAAEQDLARDILDLSDDDIERLVASLGS